MAEKDNTIKTVSVEKGRKTIWHLQQMKEKGEKISMVGTAYLHPMFTMLCEKAGVDLVRYTVPGETGHDRAELVLMWTRMQRKQAPNICLNAVMQTEDYGDPATAVRKGAQIMTDGADSVMPMGVTNEVVKAMADNYVAVFGHIGVLSGWQTGRFGGYRRVGKTCEDAMRVFKMGYEYQENGMAGMTVEMTPREVTNAIAAKLRVPVIEVAGGGAADGSEMVIFDMLGFMPPEMMGRHAKVYANVMMDTIKAVGAWTQEVKTGAYPLEEHGWGMDEAELAKFNEAIDKF